MTDPVNLLPPIPFFLWAVAFLTFTAVVAVALVLAGVRECIERSGPDPFEKESGERRL